MTAQYEVRGNVAVILLDNPPVNGLGLATRKPVSKGAARRGRPSRASGGVDGRRRPSRRGGHQEFGQPSALAEPSLHTLIRVVETCSKPVVAALHNVCMGGGLELALGCHYRVAEAKATLALPEVKLGLVPGAGGTCACRVPWAWSPR